MGFLYTITGYFFLFYSPVRVVKHSTLIGVECLALIFQVCANPGYCKARDLQQYDIEMLSCHHSHVKNKKDTIKIEYNDVDCFMQVYFISL